MSELSEALTAALADPTKAGRMEELTKKGPPPGWEHLRQWVGWNTARIIRPARFYYNGKQAWETSDQAMEEVCGYVNQAVFSFMISSMAKGMIAGIQYENLPKKYNWEDLFTRAGEPMWLEAQLEAERFIAADEEVMDLIRDHLIKHTAFFSTMHGFKDATDKQTLHVYEIISKTIMQAGTAIYLAGMATGEICKQALVLAEMEKEISGFPE